MPLGGPRIELTAVSDQLLEAMADGIVIVDETGRITFVNRQVEALSGYRRDELVGESIEMLVPDRFRSAHVANRSGYVSGHPRGRAMGSGLEIRFRRKDGGEFPADIALSPIREGGRLQVLAAIRDVTERQRANARLEALREINERILRGGAPDDALGLIAQRARELVGAAVGYISRPDQEAESVLPAAGPSIVVPLEVGDRRYGTLAVANAPAAAEFGPEDVRLIQLFAAQAAVALEYARIRADLERLAVAEDRERIGREIHDGAIQALFAVGMSLQAAAGVAAGTDLGSRLEEAVDQIDVVIHDLRNYIFGLRPGILTDRALDQALRELAADTEQKSGVTIVVDVDPRVASGLARKSGDVVQLAREALSNVVRHASATTTRVSLRSAGQGVVLEVEDDGTGFDPSKIRGTGFGLRNLRERVTRLGGEMEIESVPGEGTAVRFRLPL